MLKLSDIFGLILQNGKCLQEISLVLLYPSHQEIIAWQLNERNSQVHPKFFQVIFKVVEFSHN